MGGTALEVAAGEDKTGDELKTSLILVPRLVEVAHSESPFLHVVHSLSVQDDQSSLRRSASQRSIKQAAVNASLIRRRKERKKKKHQVILSSDIKM